MKESLVKETITKCRALFCIPRSVIVDCRLEVSSDSWGCCSQVSDTHYIVRINPDMSIRDTVATTIHEMTHIKQWLFPPHDSIVDDGEVEAEKIQYKLTDLLWELGLL